MVTYKHEVNVSEASKLGGSTRADFVAAIKRIWEIKEDSAPGPEVQFGTILTAEPYRWYSTPVGMAPDGLAEWTITRVRERNGGPFREIDRLPGERDVDADAVYLLDLAR